MAKPQQEGYITWLMAKYRHISHGFESVFDSRSRVLVLGSFPSEKSRIEGFYYGNPRREYASVALPPVASSYTVHASMQGNKGKDTKPELLVRRRLHAAGLCGYRLHWKVPGMSKGRRFSAKRPEASFASLNIKLAMCGRRPCA